jgi:hypothetical protein
MPGRAREPRRNASASTATLPPITACTPYPPVYRSGSHSLRQAGFVGDDMTLINLLLWLVFAALIAIVPIGCIMTRPSKKAAPQAEKSS